MDASPSAAGPTPSHDVLVIGGGGAGLAAALQMGRSRRSVVVADGGEPRNAPAAHMHGYLGHDGAPPQDFLATARAEVADYGVELVAGTVATLRTGEAAAEGSRVGAVINADLAHEDAERATATEGDVLGDTSSDWDRRYSGV